MSRFPIVPPMKWFLFLTLVAMTPDIVVAVDLDQIALEGAQGAQRIESIDIELRGHVKYDFRYIQKGAQYRLEIWETNANRSLSQPVRVVTFDGSKYYWLNGGFLAVGSKPNEGRVIPVTNNPLFVPFHWLFTSQNNYTWSVVCDAKAWKDSLSKGKYVGNSEVDGIPCYHIRKQFTRAEMDIWFAKDFSCFPVRWASKSTTDATISSEAKVVRYKLVNTPLGQVFIPVESKYFQSGGMHTLRIDRTSFIEEKSLKVNQGIDPELFTLTATHKTIVIDRDNPRQSDLRREHVKLDESEEHRNIWLIAVTLAALVVLVTIFIARRLRRRSGNCGG